MNQEKINFYEVFVEDDIAKEANRLVKKKHFHSLPNQILEVVNKCEHGIFAGDNILTIDEPTEIRVYKLRLPNPDANVGKSNGYRIIYAIAIEHKIVVLLTLYYKKENATIHESRILGMIDAFIAEHLSDLPENDEDEE